MINPLAILDARTKFLPGMAYKLSDSGQYGMDTIISGNTDLDESRMSAWVPFASGERRDGVGDLLEVSGILTERHRANPVVLLDHGKSVALPIAKAEDPVTGSYTVIVDQAANQAKLNAFFYQGGSREHSLLCEQVYDLLAKKYIRAGSIGYQVVKAVALAPNYQTGTPQGLHLQQVLMLEGSIVVMPANQDTVRKGLGDNLARKILCLGNVCGKPLSPVLVKSLTPYAGKRKAQLGYEGKMDNQQQPVPQAGTRFYPNGTLPIEGSDPNDKASYPHGTNRSEDEVGPGDMGERYRPPNMQITPPYLDNLGRRFHGRPNMHDIRDDMTRPRESASNVGATGRLYRPGTQPPHGQDEPESKATKIPPARWKPGVGAIKALRLKYRIKGEGLNQPPPARRVTGPPRTENTRGKEALRAHPANYREMSEDDDFPRANQHRHQGGGGPGTYEGRGKVRTVGTGHYPSDHPVRGARRQIYRDRAADQVRASDREMGGGHSSPLSDFQYERDFDDVKPRRPERDKPSMPGTNNASEPGGVVKPGTETKLPQEQPTKPESNTRLQSGDYKSAKALRLKYRIKGSGPNRSVRHIIDKVDADSIHTTPLSQEDPDTYPTDIPQYSSTARYPNVRRRAESKEPIEIAGVVLSRRPGETATPDPEVTNDETEAGPRSPASHPENNPGRRSRSGGKAIDDQEGKIRDREQAFLLDRDRTDRTKAMQLIEPETEFGDYQDTPEGKNSRGVVSEILHDSEHRAEKERHPPGDYSSSSQEPLAERGRNRKDKVKSLRLKYRVKAEGPNPIQPTPDRTTYYPEKVVGEDAAASGVEMPGHFADYEDHDNMGGGFHGPEYTEQYSTSGGRPNRWNTGGPRKGPEPARNITRSEQKGQKSGGPNRTAQSIQPADEDHPMVAYDIEHSEYGPDAPEGLQLRRDVGRMQQEQDAFRQNDHRTTPQTSTRRLQRGALGNLVEGRARQVTADNAGYTGRRVQDGVAEQGTRPEKKGITQPSRQTTKPEPREPDINEGEFTPSRPLSEKESENIPLGQTTEHMTSEQDRSTKVPEGRRLPQRSARNQSGVSKEQRGMKELRMKYRPVTEDCGCGCKMVPVKSHSRRVNSPVGKVEEKGSGPNERQEPRGYVTIENDQVSTPRMPEFVDDYDEFDHGGYNPEMGTTPMSTMTVKTTVENEKNSKSPTVTGPKSTVPPRNQTRPETKSAVKEIAALQAKQIADITKTLQKFITAMKGI